jgi:sulfur relay (sulfurtransferase) complex TusBCD TusD component (DsrE family)
MPRTTITLALMDPPYESANLTTAFRILDVAVRRGYDVNVFAYEGAAALAFARQAPHPNPVHGKSLRRRTTRRRRIRSRRSWRRPSAMAARSIG